MKKIILLFTLIFTTITFAQKDFDVVFKNVNVVSLEGETVLKNQNVGIKDGLILVIENAKKSKLKGDKEYDLNGKYIMPALADAHVHFPKTAEEMPRFFEMNLVNGITKLRSMRGEWVHT